MFKVSVIVPNYNRAIFIGEMIKSIQSQTYSNWELIIVDDGSSDDSITVIESYLNDSRIKLFARPSNRPKGGNAARNFGYEMSTGDYIKWLDSDDLLASHCLEKQTNFAKEGNFDVVFSRSRFFKKREENGDLIWDKYWSKSFPLKDPFNNYLGGKIRFSTADGLWKKDFLEKKPFQEDLRNSQEWLMLVNELSKNPNSFIDSEVLVYSRMHEDQMHFNKNIDFYYKHQILARYYAIQTLIEHKRLTKTNFEYLVKNMILNFLSPVKKVHFRYFGCNLKKLVSGFFNGVIYLLQN